MPAARQGTSQLQRPAPRLGATASTDKAPGVELNVPPAAPMPFADVPLELPQTEAEAEAARRASADYLAELEDAGGEEEDQDARQRRMQARWLQPSSSAGGQPLDQPLHEQMDEPPPSGSKSLLALLGAAVSEGLQLKTDSSSADSHPSNGGHSMAGATYESGAGEEGELMTPYRDFGYPYTYDDLHNSSEDATIILGNPEGASAGQPPGPAAPAHAVVWPEPQPSVLLDALRAFSSHLVKDDTADPLAAPPRQTAARPFAWTRVNTGMAPDFKDSRVSTLL